MADALLDRLGVSEVVFLTFALTRVSSICNFGISYNENNSSKITGNLEMALRHLLAVGYDNSASLRS